MKLKPVNAIILCGGQSRRMGSNKAFLPLGKSTFLQTLIDTLKTLTNQVIISGDPKLYKQFGCEVIIDCYSNCGPLSGILSGLNASNTEWNFIVSVDTPLVNKNIFTTLQDQINQQQVVIAKTTKRTMPLIGFYHQSCKAKIEEALQNGNLKVMQTLETLKTEEKMIDIQQQTLLHNINTPEDYSIHLQTISICFFGQLAEITSCSQIEYSIPRGSTIEDVKKLLFKNYPALKGKVYKMALNNAFVTDEEILTKQAKIDVLPAFAGG